MGEERTESYYMAYPDDMNVKFLDSFHKAYQLLNTLDEIKDKKPTICYCRNNRFVMDLVVEDRIAEYIRDLIIYNLDKMETKSDLELLVIHLEELVHCYCDTLDEHLTGRIVVSLIPEIRFDEESCSYKDS